MWLKPGTQQIFGRTKPPKKSNADGHIYYINDKKVSRQHITISVSAVKPGDGIKLYSRSQLRIIETSKFGTSIDGEERFKQETRALTKDEHTIQLGSWDQFLRVKWQPVIFAFSFTNKEYKSNNNPLASVQARLEPLDIKTTTDYVIGQTTHVVVAKRNTPKGLQALIDGKYVVTTAFVDAVVQAASAQNSDADNYIPSLFELDFDTHWPNELEYLPPAGQEPVPRSKDFFKPKVERGEIFSGHTFIFCDEGQIENLRGPITTGGGKALLYDLIWGQTTVEEFVQYVKNIAGKKGIGQFEDQNDSKGVVVVRFTQPETDEWARDFVQNVDLALNQRSVNQNEFLDAILINDARSLRKELEEDTQVSSSIPAPSRIGLATKAKPAGPNNTTHSPSELPESSAPLTTRRRARRAIATNRFKGFDQFDDFDPSEPPKAKPSLDDVPIEDIAESQYLKNPHEDFRSHSAAETQLQPDTASRKRRSPPSDKSTKDSDHMDNLFPAAAAMKKRRIESARLATTGASPSPEIDTQKPKGKAATVLDQLRKAEKKEKHVDVLELARSRREAEEEAARLDAESLRNAMEGMDVSAMRNLAHVEEMDVRPRTDISTTQVEEPDRRWDDRWNGRKNFKRFKRRGGAEAPIQGHKVIVQLEEVRKKDFGIGEEYWLESGERGGESIHETQRSIKGRKEEEDDNSEEHSFTRRRGAARRTLIKESDDEGEQVEPEVVEPPRNRRLADKVREAQDRLPRTQTPMQTAQTESEVHTTRSRGKRAAVSAAENSPPVKRTRGALPKNDKDDSGDDEKQFRFRRRRI